MAARGEPAPASAAAAAALFGMSVSLMINRESGFGVTRGHAEALELIAGFLNRFDPQD